VTLLPRRITYRVNNNGMLERNDGVGGWQQLIDNVEDLQLVYAFDRDADGDIETDGGGLIWAVDTDGDTDGDGSADLDTQVIGDGTTAPLGFEVNYTNDPGDTTDRTGDPFNCPIRAVRISLVVRTDREDPSFPVMGQRPQLDDRAAASVNDQFRRRVLRSVAKFRNTGLGVQLP
jgi:hypothetical protein